MPQILEKKIEKGEHSVEARGPRLDLNQESID